MRRRGGEERAIWIKIDLGITRLHSKQVQKKYRSIRSHDICETDVERIVSQGNSVDLANFSICTGTSTLYFSYPGRNPSAMGQFKFQTIFLRKFWIFWLCPLEACTSNFFFHAGIIVYFMARKIELIFNRVGFGVMWKVRMRYRNVLLHVFEITVFINQTLCQFTFDDCACKVARSVRSARNLQLQSMNKCILNGTN